MNKRSLLTLSLFAFFIGTLCLALCYLFFGMIRIEDIVLPLALGLVGASVATKKSGGKALALSLLVVALLLTILNRGAVSVFDHKAKILDAFVYIIYGLLPFFALIPFYWEVKEHKGLSSIVVLILFAILFMTEERYTGVYSYLYEFSPNYSSSLYTARVAIIALGCATLSEVFFDTERNYLSYFLLLIAALSFGLNGAIFLSLEGGAVEYLKGMISTPYWWWMIFDLIIYSYFETSAKKKSERRNIIFKDMVYQEVKPLKKRVRKITFEIPPNVPKFKNDLTLKKESENINNEQNDN